MTIEIDEAALNGYKVNDSSFIEMRSEVKMSEQNWKKFIVIPSLNHRTYLRIRLR